MTAHERAVLHLIEKLQQEVTIAFTAISLGLGRSTGSEIMMSGPESRMSGSGHRSVVCVPRNRMGYSRLDAVRKRTQELQARPQSLCGWQVVLRKPVDRVVCL